MGLWRLLTIALIAPSEAVLLREWLRGLEVSIPNFEISHALSKLGLSLNVTGGQCQGIELQEFRLVETSADEKHMAFTLQMDLGISCQVNTTLQAAGQHRCELELGSAAAVARVGLQVPVQDGLPGTTLVSCELQPDLTKFNVLTRSLACDPLRLVERPLQEFINDFASKLLCAKVSSDLSQNLAQASQELRRLASPFFTPAEVLPLPPSAQEALDLRQIWWKGPMGHVLRSFLNEVVHVENATKLDEVLRFLQRDLKLHPRVPTGTWKAPVPWIEDLFLSLVLQNASLDLTNVEDLHFQFSAASAARIRGALAPRVTLAAKTALLLPDNVATLMLGGYKVNVSQHVALSPLQLQLRAIFQVIGAATGFVAYNATGLDALQFDQMQRASCASAYLVQNAGLPLQLLEARCSPQLREYQVELPELDVGDLELELLKVAEELLRLFQVAFGASVPKLLDGYISLRGRAAVNDMLEESLKPSTCPSSNFSSGELRAIDVPAGYTSVAFLSATLVFFAVHLCWIFLRRKSLPGESSPASQLENGFLPEDQGAESAPASRGLGWQPGVPWCLRWGMLSGIAGTTFLFVYASVTPGVLFSGSFEASRSSSATKHMASLSMENSLAQTLEVGSVFVFAAMLIFSVIWPYIKLLMMVYVWAAPVDPDTRGPALFFLDRIGKWSLMDNIILFLFISFFWIAWVGEDVVSGGQATFGLRCSPGIELNTFLAATILSLLLGHAMLWVHRWYSPKEDCGATALSVGRSLFRGAAHRKLQILGLCQIGCILLTVASWQFEVVDVSFDGLVATFLKVTDQPISMRYSIMGLLSRLGKQGSRYLQVTFAIFVLIIPVLYLLAMAFLCLVKLQPKKQQLLLRLCYTLNAWAAYDAFLIAFLAAVLGGERYGIGQFIELVVYQQNLAPTCDALRDIGVSCMHVQLSLLPGALLILVAVVASFTVSLLASRELNMT